MILPYESDTCITYSLTNYFIRQFIVLYWIGEKKLLQIFPPPTQYERRWKEIKCNWIFKCGLNIFALNLTEYDGPETGGPRPVTHLLSEWELLLQHHSCPGPRSPQITGAQAGEHDPTGHQGHMAGPSTVRGGWDFCELLIKKTWTVFITWLLPFDQCFYSSD